MPKSNVFIAQPLRPLGLHYNHYVSMSVRQLPVGENVHSLNLMVYFYHILHTYTCQYSLATGMRNHLFLMDMGLLSNCPAYCGQLVKILITLKPYGIFIPPANYVCGGYTVFTSVRVCVRPCVLASVRLSITFCFLNNLKSHCWIFIKPCKHVHICKTNTLDNKVRARGQFC